jgi:hypothetical protein
MIGSGPVWIGLENYRLQCLRVRALQTAEKLAPGERFVSGHEFTRATGASKERVGLSPCGVFQTEPLPDNLLGPNGKGWRRFAQSGTGVSSSKLQFAVLRFICRSANLPLPCLEADSEKCRFTQKIATGQNAMQAI